MVEKVPFLKGAGAPWLRDLTTPDALCIFPMITSLFVMLPFEVCVQFFLSKCMFVLGLQNLRCHLLHPSTIFPAEPAGSTQERQVQMRVRGASSIDRRSFFVRKDVPLQGAKERGLSSRLHPS